MKKIVAWSSVAVLLFASANVFAGLPKPRRMKIGGVNVRVKPISGVASRGVKPHYARPKASRTPSVTAVRGNLRGVEQSVRQRAEHAVWLAEFSRRGSYLHPRPHADVPTRMHAYRLHQWAKGYSKQERDPSILAREEPGIASMRQKREQLSKRMEAKVEELHAQYKNAGPVYRDIIRYYDNLRAAENKRHQDIEKNIIDRQMQGDTQVQYQHEPEMNRHLDEIDAINASEIQAFQLLEE